MTYRFDYQNSSVEEIAAHLTTVSRQAIFLVRKYYTERGNDVVLSKINQATEIAKVELKKARLQAALDALSNLG